MQTKQTVTLNSGIAKISNRDNDRAGNNGHTVLGAEEVMGQRLHALIGSCQARRPPWAMPGPGGWARGPARHGPFCFIFYIYVKYSQRGLKIRPTG